MIKAIETVYNGYRFRSRLEARWAVFFDALGIEYQYEPEGFDLGEAGWYLPDFWFPGLETWFEVKGPEPKEFEMRLATALCAGSGHRVVVYSGGIEYPRPRVIRSIAVLYQGIQKYPTLTLENLFQGTTVLEGNVWINGDRYYVVKGPNVKCYQNYFWGECPHCGQIDLCFHGTGWHSKCPKWAKEKKSFRRTFLSNKLKQAYALARQARFEHGETPNPADLRL